MKQHHGKVEKMNHLPRDTSEKGSSHIPFFWSEPTIYSESARRALEATHRREINLNFHALYACCLIYESRYYKLVFEAMFRNRGLVKRVYISGLVGLSSAHLLVIRGVNYSLNGLMLRFIATLLVVWLLSHLHIHLGENRLLSLLWIGFSTLAYLVICFLLFIEKRYLLTFREGILNILKRT